MTALVKRRRRQNSELSQLLMLHNAVYRRVVHELKVLSRAERAAEHQQQKRCAKLCDECGGPPDAHDTGCSQCP